MSVINRMLRDLDQRQQQTKNQTYTPAAIAPQPIHWAWIVTMMLVSAAIIVGALNLWWLYSSHELPTENVEPIAERSVEVTKVAVPQKANETPSEPASTEQSVRPQAKAIVDVSPLRPAQQSVAEPVQQAVVEQTQPTPQPTPQRTQTATQEPAQVVETKAPAKTQAPAKAEGKSSFAVTRVQLSPQELADTNLAKAKEAFQKGDQARGQELLEKALMVMPEHVEVRSELAAYWYGRGMATRALTLLQQGLDMKPQEGQWQLLFARMLERIGRVDQAYTALINIRNDIPEAPELLQLRAVAANQLGYFNEAAADYTALAVEYGEARWWLAAAVAQEDGGNLEAAVRSYRQALQYRGLGNEARDYIEQRLEVLEGY